MGAPLTEFVIETVLRDGLGDLKTNPNKLDDLFSRFTEAHFINQFGITQITRLKTYIQNNQIKLTQSHSMIQTVIPCISIQLIRADESEGIQNLGNEYLDEEEDKTPTVIVPVVDPGTYDTLTGKLTIINAADLSGVCPNLIFVDSLGTKFDIKPGNSNLSGNKFINIGSGMEPSLAAGGRIESWIDFKRTERRMIRLRETIRLGCHAKDDIHIAKYLYYIVMYILKSRQDSMINRGLHLDRGTASIFDREDTFSGENVFSRYIDVNCITEFDWDQAEVNLVDCFDLTLKVPAPKPDSEDTIVITNTSDE